MLLMTIVAGNGRLSFEMEYLHRRTKATLPVDVPVDVETGVLWVLFNEAAS
jgi:hypothetical protein